MIHLRRGVRWRYFVIIVGALSLPLLLSSPTILFSYDEATTHPALTDEAVDFYNLSFPSQAITKEEKEWIIEGSSDEDTWPRWVNHFYDPIHNQGWSAEEFGRLSPATARALNKAILSDYPPVALKYWAVLPNIQAQYKDFGGNRTWQRAIYELTKNHDKNEAYYTLGFILHLLEDATVPDHTRNDTHAAPLKGLTGDIGSPYEEYAKRFFRSGGSTNLPITAESLRDKGVKPELKSRLADYFESIANYSNRYFFSKDTVPVYGISGELIYGKFQYPKILIEKGKIAYGSDKDGSEMPLARIDRVVTEKRKVVSVYNLAADDSDNLVLAQYFTRLSREAIINGAGVIKLFFDEVKKAQDGEVSLKDLPTEQSGIDSSLATEKRVEQKYQDIKQDIQNVLQILPIKLGLRQTLPEPPKPVNSARAPSVKPQVLGEKIFSSPTIETPRQPITQPVVIAPISPAPPVFMPAPSGGSSSQSSSGNPPSAALSPPAPAIAPALLEPAAASTPSESPEVIVAKDTIPPAAPLLDSFFYDAIFTTSSLNNIFGAHSTDTAKIQMYFSSSADVAGAPAGSQPAVTSSVDWKFPVSLNSGYNYYYFTATDDAGNTSTLSSRALLVLDTIAPPVPLVTVTDQTSASSTNLHIELAGGDLLSPITFYELDYRTSTDWISLVSGATSTSFDIPGVRGREYSFRARARDILGNTSEWSMATRQCAAGSCVDSAAPVFINWSGEVVINEIAWAGTSADYSRDEWLELYNTTNQPIDLKAWKIMVSGEPINFSRIINAVIPARGYFLLERGYDENIREVPADIIYTLSGGFKNSGEKIELLKPGGEKADEVDNSGGWSAGDNKRYRTMERINPLRPGNDRYNWQSNAGQRMGPRTYNGGQIYGSPKQPNFGFIALTEQQEDVNRVLRAADSPYVLGYYEIPAGYTLTVEPGVVIKSYYPVAGMNIYGTLVTLGAASSSITFTSGRDQDFATARDATVVGTGWKDGASPQVKDWQGLWFRPGSTGNLSGLTLRFAAKDFRPANSGVWSPGVWQGLRANSANLTITDSVLMNNGAVYLSNSSTTIKNTVFSIGERAVEADGGSLSLENSDFSAFTNASGPIYAKNLWPALVRLSFRDNGFNAPLLELVSVNVSTTIKRGESVILSSLITVNKGATLTIEPGAKLYMGSYSILEVNGTLEAVGTAAEPIIITPFAAGEQWSHIVFNHSTSTLRHVAVSGGNKHLRHYTTTDGALLVNDSFVTLSDCSVMDSREPGDSIRTSASRLVMSNCSLGHSQRSKFDTVGITAVGGEVSLDAVRFNNLTVGLFGEDANQPPRVGLDNIFRSSFTNVDTIFVGLDWLTPLLAP